MLPRFDAPATRLPYTTADMSERLAKKKTEQANGAFRYGIANPPTPVPEPKKSGGTGLWPSWGEIGNAAKSGYSTASGMVNTVVATPIDAVDWANQQLTKYVAGQEPVDQFDPASIGSFNLLGETDRGLQQAARRAVGDIAAIPGVGKPSASPTATDIRRYGVLEGLSGAALDYGNLAATAAPFVGPAAKGIQGIRGAQVAAKNPYTYGVHVSSVSDLAEIQARQAMQQQATAGDAMAGSSYMWDARSPRTVGSIFDNPQMNPANKDFMMSPEEIAAQATPNIYITRAPAGQVFQDANVPGSASLRVAGNQEVLSQIPFSREALEAAMQKYAGTTRNIKADIAESNYRGLNPTVKANIAARSQQLAEEALRKTITSSANPYYAKNFPGLSELNPNASLAELLRNPDAKRFYDQYVAR